MQLKTVNYNPCYANGVIELSDKIIGPHFITSEDLDGFFGEPRTPNRDCSWILLGPHGQVLGARITFSPKNWTPFALKKSLSPKLFPNELLAYFKTLLVDPTLQGKGWGPKLTQLSIKSLNKTGATAVICHCWKESPQNSSFKYLTKLGFEPVGEIKNFWQDIDYECVVCKPHKCSCTAIEMIKKLEKEAK